MTILLSQRDCSRLLVVIVNYRTPELTIDSLRSLQPEIEAVPGAHVVVTDNDSQDGSVDKIAAAIAEYQWASWVSLMPLDRNGGFAFGNNAAIRVALAAPRPPQYIWLLNPDTIVHPNGLTALINFMDRHPTVGLAGSRLENLDGTPQHSAFRFPSLWSELDYGLHLGFVTRLLKAWEVAPPIVTETCPTDWLSGASILVRREVFETAGLLDEKYFMYFEEVDFCRQAQTQGWSCWYVPQSRVIHLVGQSSGMVATKPTKRRPQYWFNSRRRYFLKNHGWLYAAATDALWMGAYLIRRLKDAMKGAPNNEPPHLFLDFWSNSVFLKGSGS
ncbi:glycosyltransferase family 2 protein [Alkalinema sp. FACHB-956]|uniref:glycosyltransferase family 2 protein n=1 Tax=Alkalinema sp. FACHB-956 TaxID=2692768 RepID=UPI001686FA24|nr:glycosyltransferase family 2 protein [Alkalinema sp. FACHB-956]MBD2328097.1 glycosyltransferase family 2 protein [Alkalinema sp. FACHB-956]